MEVLEKHTRVVAFRVGPHELLQALQPIPHQIRLAQLLHHRSLSLQRRLSLYPYTHLLIGYRTSILRHQRCAAKNRRATTSGSGMVQNVAMGPVEIFLAIVVLALVAYVVWRLVIRPRR